MKHRDALLFVVLILILASLACGGVDYDAPATATAAFEADLEIAATLTAEVVR